MKKPNVNNLPRFVSQLQSPDLTEIHEAIIGIRKLLSVLNPPIQAVIDANIVPRAIQILNESNYPRLQIEAAWALTNIASGTSAQCQLLIDCGCIPVFIKLLSSDCSLVVHQVIWAIGNIGADSPINRNLIISLGGVDPLMKIIKNSPVVNVMV